MTRRRSAAAAIALVALAVPAAPADAAARTKCQVSSTTGGAKIVKRSSTAVIFSKRLGVYGCLLRGGGPVKPLLDEGGGIRLVGRNAPQLRGGYVGYVTYGSAIGDEFDRVVAWDLRRGRIKVEGSSNFVRSFVLTASGSIAWIQGSAVRPAQPDRAVHEVRGISAVEFEGSRLFDRGDDIAPESVVESAAGGGVSWTRGGQTRTARLP